MFSWYVAHTHARGEHKARFNLLRQGFEVYLPQFLKRRRHARTISDVPTPLFPRYLFVGFDRERARWRSIHSTIGVQRLLCHGDEPTPAPASVVEEIRARQADDGFVRLGRLSRFAPGDPVRIANGALCDQVGLFEAIDDQQRVSVLLNLLGRQVRVRVALDSVCAPAA